MRQFDPHDHLVEVPSVARPGPPLAQASRDRGPFPPLVLRCRLARVRALVDRHQPHQTHEPLDPLAVDQVTLWSPAMPPFGASRNTAEPDSAGRSVS